MATSDQEKCDIIRDHYAKTYVARSTYAPCPVVTSERIDTLDSVEVDPAVVLKYLQQLPGKTSTTPEGIPALFFKRAAAGLAKPLSLIYQRSLSEGRVPTVYKTAIIAPVHKSGDKTDAGNKRPISLTAVSCKVLERILADRIYENANAQGLISDQQFAYRPGRSTTQCIIEYLNDIALWSNDKIPSDTLMFDMKNAFELCNLFDPDIHPAPNGRRIGSDQLDN